MRVTVASNLNQVAAAAQQFHPQFRFACALALTRTAQQIQQAERAEMRRVFDRPIPWTLNSLFLRMATKQTLEAMVWFKPTWQERHYIEPQVYGGQRPIKAFEYRLQQAGVMPQGWVAIPGKGARLDAYGNISRGQLVQILSVLFALPTAGAGQGYQATPTARSRQRNKKSRDYFVSGPTTAARLGNNGRLPFGVYERTADKRVTTILRFRPQANYTKRFDFFGVAERVRRTNFERNLSEAWEQALRTARRPSRLAA